MGFRVSPIYIALTQDKTDNPEDADSANATDYQEFYERYSVTPGDLVYRLPYDLGTSTTDDPHDEAPRDKNLVAYDDCVEDYFKNNDYDAYTAEVDEAIQIKCGHFLDAYKTKQFIDGYLERYHAESSGMKGQIHVPEFVGENHGDVRSSWDPEISRVVGEQGVEYYLFYGLHDVSISLPDESAQPKPTEAEQERWLRELFVEYGIDQDAIDEFLKDK